MAPSALGADRRPGPALYMLNGEDATANAARLIDVIRARFEAHPQRAYLVEVPRHR